MTVCDLTTLIATNFPCATHERVKCELCLENITYKLTLDFWLKEAPPKLLENMLSLYPNLIQ